MLWTRSLLPRLLAPYLVALGAIALALYVYGESAVRRLHVDTVARDTLRQAKLVGDLLPWDARGAPMDRRCAELRDLGGARITVIDEDGTVIGDSDVASETLENHRDRPEVSAAWLHGDGSDRRSSESVHRELFYRAWRQQRGGERRVVRVALELEDIESTLGQIRSALWGGIGIAALAALWPALAISRRLSRRLGRLNEFSEAVTHGTPPPPLTPGGSDIVGNLETNLLQMAKTLREQVDSAREGEGKLQGVLSGMAEGVLVIDRTGTVVLANRRAQQLLGAPGDESLVGSELIRLSRDPALQSLVREMVRGSVGPAAVSEITLDTAARERLQVTATPITDPDGHPREFILVFHDITELTKLEATRRDFVENVSHELRTPLTAIRGYADTLRGGKISDSETASRFLRVIERNADRMSRLVDDLITLSDLELGRTELRRRAVPLRALVDAAVEVVQHKAADGQVALRVDLVADLPPAVVDPDRVEQVLVNLIDNAVKYTPPQGQVTVSARVAPPVNGRSAPAAAEGDSRWLEICIADTGVGIPSQDIPRLTERFYRVDRARSRELGGTGLGLAIVKHVVHAHGGVLRIESELGHGTRVFVSVPVRGAAPPTA